MKSLLILITLWIFQTAIAGTSIIGGGNGKKSTLQDLKGYSFGIDYELLMIGDMWLNADWDKGLNVTQTPLSKELSGITQKILGRDFFTLGKHMKFPKTYGRVKVVDGPCYEGNVETDSSSEIGKVNGEICLSGTRLTRIPKFAFREAIMPLIFHEIAHQFGYDEAHAQAFQDLTELYMAFRKPTVLLDTALFRCAQVSVGSGVDWRLETTKGQVLEWAKNPVYFMVGPQEAILQCGSISAMSSIFLSKTLENFPPEAGMQEPRKPLGITENENKSLLLIGRHYQTFPKPAYSLSIALGILSNEAIMGSEDLAKQGLTNAYANFLAAKSLRAFIDYEVGRRQNLIRVASDKK